MAATGQISVETLEKTGEAIIPDLLYKYQIHAGAGEVVPPNSVVEINYRVISRGQTVLESNELQPYKQHLERILPPGLSIALATMRRGERALISMASVLAFGENTNPWNSELRIPKSSKLVFEVELLSWTEDALSRLQFKKAKACPSLSHIEDEFEEAEELIERRKLLSALPKLIKCMHAARSLRINAETSKKEEAARIKLNRMVTARAAECAYHTTKYPLAVSLSKEVLQMDDMDAHMNYIRGCAYFSLGHISLAFRDVNKAHSLDILNEAYAKKFEEIKNHQQLLTRDVVEDCAKEDFEEFAELCLQRIKQKEGSLTRGISDFINRGLQRSESRIVIGGGFPPELLTPIVEGCVLNRIRVIHSEPDCFEVLL